MSVANILSNDQQLLIEKISQPPSRVNREKATVSIYLYFNRLAKPVEELRPVIAAVDPTLLSKETVGECLKWMKEEGLAAEVFDDKVDMNYIEITAEFEELMENLTRINGLADALRKAYSNQTPKVWVGPKGVVRSGKRNYTEMLEIIRHAQKRVDYAVLTTEPYPATVSALKIAANNGVYVRILVASEKIAREHKKQGSVEDLWKEEFKSYKNVHIRVSEDNTIAELCSSIQVDNILRLDVYDPHRIRSLDGYLIEVRNGWEENINLIHWYSEKFEKIWNSAYSSGKKRKIKKYLTPFNVSVVVAVLGIVAFFCFRLALDPVQSLVDEMLLLVIGAAGENAVRIAWPKIKSLPSAIITALRDAS